MNVNAVMMVFCQYGFRKASMEDIAKAAGVSRQSIYKKFGSKEKAFDWAINSATEEALENALTALAQEQKSIPERIADAFDNWTGAFVPVLRGTQHGGEILERAIETATQCGTTYDDTFYQALEDLLLCSGIVTDPVMAADKAYGLGMASKGLLLKAETSDGFRTNMERIIRAVLNT